MRGIIRLRSRRGRQGISMVEFALVFLLFVLVIAAVIEFGRGVWTFNTIAHAARQGARFAMIRGSTNPTTADDVRNVVRNAAIGLDRNQVQVSTTWPNGVVKGNVVQVQVNYPFALVTGSLLLRQSTIQIKASSEVILAN